MFAVVTPEKIHLPPGTVMKFPGTWQDYQALVQQLGDRQIPRIKYRPGEILLMSPLPVHGRQAHIIAMVAMVLLDYLGLEYEAFTPITMDLPEVRGLNRIIVFISIIGRRSQVRTGLLGVSNHRRIWRSRWMSLATRM